VPAARTMRALAGGVRRRLRAAGADATAHRMDARPLLRPHDAHRPRRGRQAPVAHARDDVGGHARRAGRAGGAAALARRAGARRRLRMRVPAERILIVLLGAIGDVVRGLPLATRLRAGYPNARLAWAVEPRAAPLLEHHPALDERLVFERAGGARSFLAFLRRVRAGGFDLVLDLQRHAKSGAVSWASGA